MFKNTPVTAVAAAVIALFTGACAATNAGTVSKVEAAPAPAAAAAPAPVAAAPAAAPAAAAPAKPDYTKMSAKDLAEYMIFESGSYDLKQATQEGTSGRDRLTQDAIQKACSLMKGQELDDKTRDMVSSLAAASVKYPEGGIKLGDWKKGRELAWSGFGYRTAHQPDDHSNREAGGNCYNCHQIATDRTGGDIGPALTGYGARGTSPEVLKYTYDVIYNPHAYFACTNMPRMGSTGVLNQQQIADVMAYLLDPASPVNK
jgi:sulfur-oxidizing protein SoxX